MAVIVALSVALAASGWWLVDNAFISWRYALNLAEGHGLRYNRGPAPPVEGYSNPGWVLLATAAELVGLFPGTVANLVAMACAAALLVLVWQTARDDLGLEAGPSLAAVAALGWSAPFACWSTSGLETMPQALCFFVVARSTRFGQGSRDGAFAALAAAALVLLRTEGLVWVVLAWGVAAATRERSRPLGASGYAPLVVAFAGTGLLEVFRIAWFGALVSNTVAAKSGMSVLSLVRGVLYVALFVGNSLTPAALLLALPAALRAGRSGVWVVLLGAAAPAWAVLVGADWMPFSRLILPSLPFLALMAGLGWQAAWASLGRAALPVSLAVAALGAVPLTGRTLLPESALLRLNFNSRGIGEVRWRDGTFRPTALLDARDPELLALALQGFARPGDLLVSGVIGRVGYFNPDVVILDQCGLVNRRVGRMPGRGAARPGHDQCVDATSFYAVKPDILVFFTACTLPGMPLCDTDPARAIELRATAALARFDHSGWYAPEFVEARSESGTFYGVGLRYVGPGAPREAALARFQARLAELRDGAPR